MPATRLLRDSQSDTLHCPTCKRTPLRPFHGRLVCDRCEGMMIEVEDFRHALATTEPVQVLDEGVAARRCPRCLRAMRTCQLKIGKMRCDEVLACCPDDGIWFDGGLLESVFARVERHHHRGGGGNPERGVSGMYVLLRRRSRGPMAPISAFRKRFLGCPVCTDELVLVGDRWACGHCAGTFVEGHALEAMIGDITGAPWHLPAVTGGEGKLACPVCAMAMRVETLAPVAIDRCSDHGVWFDPLELEAALRHASGVEDLASAPRVWLRRALRALAATARCRT